MREIGRAMRIFVVLVVGFIVTMSVAGSVLFAGGMLNPHEKPEQCESCHRKIPTEDDVRAGDYFLLKDTIDATCHICHAYSCCKVGDLHGGNHPSNIKDWNPDFARKPKTLPLHDGYITCNTCHLHTKPDDREDHMLVRLVKITIKKRDWSELCLDCHVDY